MTYKGHVENGAVVLDEAGHLPDGALVTIEIAVAELACRDSASTRTSLVERYRCFIGAIDGLPDDWSENHDAYLRAQHGS